MHRRGRPSEQLFACAEIASCLLCSMTSTSSRPRVSPRFLAQMRQTTPLLEHIQRKIPWKTTVAPGSSMEESPAVAHAPTPPCALESGSWANLSASCPHLTVPCFTRFNQKTQLATGSIHGLFGASQAHVPRGPGIPRRSSQALRGSQSRNLCNRPWVLFPIIKDFSHSFAFAQSSKVCARCSECSISTPAISLTFQA